jgi:hypothetical protein
MRAFSFALLVLLSPIAACAGGVCSVLNDGDAIVQLSGGRTCSARSACDVEPCAGSLKVLRGRVQVFFLKAAASRSDFATVEAPDQIELSTLGAGTDLSASIHTLLNTLFENKAAGRVTGGRYALPSGSVDPLTPSGMIAVAPGDDLVFALGTTQARTFSYRSQDGDMSSHSIDRDSNGLFHLPSAALRPGARLRGGAEGTPTVAFQVATEDKLVRLQGELGSLTALNGDSLRLRRALIYFDNGCSWNGRQELAAR